MLLDTFAQDLRIGLRLLLKEKSFSALAVLVLAVGIGAVTTQFAVVNGVLLRGFTFPRAEDMVDVQFVDPVNFRPNQFNARMTTADFADLREIQQSFDGFVGYLNGSTVNLTYNGEPKRLQGGYVTHDFFHLLGVSPTLGRNFLPEDDRPGVEKAVLLSDALWRTDFGADPRVVGKSVRVNGRSGVIIGVMPPKFSFPTNEQLWLPVNAEFPVRPRNDPGVNFISAVGRLKPGVSMEQAQAEMTRIAQRFAQEYPDTNKQFSQGFVRPLVRAFADGALPGLLFTMLGFCVGVLMIACVNVMNMQMARATLRSKELAIRSSLGASRTRLVRQMLTESLLLASFGAILGVLLAYQATDYLQSVSRNLTNPLPAWMAFEIDGRVLFLVVIATVLASLVSGLIPAILSSRASTVEVLKEGGRGNTSRTVNFVTRGLVVFQILVTSVLLIGSLLQVQSIVRQQTVDYGYDTGAVLTARMGLMEGDYPTAKERQVFYERLLREIRATSAFESAALTARFRMIFSGTSPVEIEGRQYASDSDRTVSQFESISAGFFTTLRAKIIDGRDFTDEDADEREPVAIVNAMFARKHFGNESAVGRRFRSIAQNGTNPGPWRRIVGVVPALRMQAPFDTRNDNSGYYVPFTALAIGGQTPPEGAAPQFGTIVVRPQGATRPETIAPRLHDAVKRVDPNLPLYFVTTPRASLDAILGQNRLIAAMFGVFGLVAVGLASVGLYGVMSFSVNQRRQEFGVRMALGADHGRILRLVLGQGGVQLALGLGLGLALSLVVGFLGESAIKSVLFQISPLDPVTYVGVALLLSAVALISTIVPARRATKVDPMIALRAE